MQVIECISKLADIQSKQKSRPVSADVDLSQSVSRLQCMCMSQPACYSAHAQAQYSPAGIEQHSPVQWILAKASSGGVDFCLTSNGANYFHGARHANGDDTEHQLSIINHLCYPVYCWLYRSALCVWFYVFSLFFHFINVHYSYFCLSLPYFSLKLTIIWTSQLDINEMIEWLSWLILRIIKRIKRDAWPDLRLPFQHDSSSNESPPLILISAKLYSTVTRTRTYLLVMHNKLAESCEQPKIEPKTSFSQ